ncbi:hypothetical protein JQK15_14310 [Sphingobium sp. BHU LFT2]|uniref:hypothetical protein n=1 Tax=Sphingobium sp. BHU LFT2 TaxID=2807634 RepID=UPI001BE94C44|nr:hypothetical protein [Sphingobium sp. BHU LFT2]MBT2244715.1 hypothetical protein [Sphingobium sp. BHU LFT2]
MDIQKQVAARRAQLAQQDEDEKIAQAQAVARVEAEKTRQQQEALAAIADDSGLVLKGSELELSEQPLPRIDVEGLKQSKVAALLNREARRRWTPWENWQVVGSIVGGICLIHLGGFGFIPFLFGLWRRSAINRKHRAAVRADYPAIFL